MVRLHALQRMTQHASPLEIVRQLRGGDRAADRAARPEAMAHFAPGTRGIGAVIAGAVHAGLEAGRGAREGEGDEASGVDGGFDGVGVAGGVEREGEVVGVDGGLVFGEGVVGEGVGEPEVGSGGSGVGEELGVELAGCV